MEQPLAESSNVLAGIANRKAGPVALTARAFFPYLLTVPYSMWYKITAFAILRRQEEKDRNTVGYMGNPR